MHALFADVVADGGYRQVQIQRVPVTGSGSSRGEEDHSQKHQVFLLPLDGETWVVWVSLLDHYPTVVLIRTVDGCLTKVRRGIDLAAGG